MTKANILLTRTKQIATDHWALLLILAAFLALGTAYNVGIPVLEKPVDEDQLLAQVRASLTEPS